MRTILLTPPLPCVVPAEVFDAFAWCVSGELSWQRPAEWSKDEPLTADNPPRMIFVLREDASFLPRELARLHAPALGFADEWALAPYAIDDATDELYARRVPPERAMWLATDSLPGLFWGLHDWAHFHNHGPFTERAFTELQCDVTALAWLWQNRERVGITSEEWERLRVAAVGISEARFLAEQRSFVADPLEPLAVQGLLRSRVA